MEEIKLEASLYVTGISFMAIWLFLLRINHTEIGLNIEAAKQIPDTVLILVALRFIFTHWAWKWPIFRGWLVKLPYIHGTWGGTLQSTWVNPETNTQLVPIPMNLVIRQTFSSISCTMFTKESVSHSDAAVFRDNPDSGERYLSYTYTNTPDATIRERSEIHRGAVMLAVITNPEREISGEYWTTRLTRGSITATFMTGELREKFMAPVSTNGDGEDLS